MIKILLQILTNQTIFFIHFQMGLDQGGELFFELENYISKCKVIL
jgi:hypothetical protein